MHRTDNWRLTIHYWPRAAEASLRPQPSVGFEDAPHVYRPHEVDFRHPPTREDFLTVVAQTPWMGVWKEGLLPVVKTNQWPMIAPGYKGGSVDLIDHTGRCVGQLEVWRQHSYCNSPYNVPSLGTYQGGATDQFLKRRIRDKARREDARQHVDAHRNLILERLALADDTTPMQMLDEVERLLSDGGFLKRNRIT